VGLTRAVARLDGGPARLATSSVGADADDLRSGSVRLRGWDGASPALRRIAERLVYLRPRVNPNLCVACAAAPSVPVEP